MKVWACVFITTSQPRKVVKAVRKIHGVAKADGLFGSPDAIASMDSAIDRIAEVPEVRALTPMSPGGLTRAQPPLAS